MGEYSMKKTASIIMVVVLTLVLVLTGCNSTCDDKVSTDSSTVDKAEIDDMALTSSEETASSEEELTWKWTDWTEKELLSPEGIKFKFPAKGNEEYLYNEIIYYDETRCLICSGPNSIWIANTVDESLVCLSGDQVVVDYNVAYDTLYWYNLQREVWCVSWQSEHPTAELFCEDAIGVSPFTDEAEGAIVSPEKANWDGYGGLPIYSPYGE